MALIEFRNVTKSYTKGDQMVTPLANLNLRVDAGEFVALMGPSGSGKTTLLNLIAGIDQPTSGAVLVNGGDISSLSRSRLANWRAFNVGYIFQLYHLVPVLTAYENVELPLLLHKLSRRERQQRVNIALEAVGLLDRHDHYPRQLSGGQEQRVAIARALVTDPAIIVADEPTGDLDRASADATLALLQRLNRELGKTLVMVTHDPHAASVARRIIHLDKGMIVDEGTNTPLPPDVVEFAPEPDYRRREQSYTYSASAETEVVPPRKSRGRSYAAFAVIALLIVAAFAAWKLTLGRASVVQQDDLQIATLRVHNGYHPDKLMVETGKPVLLKIMKDDKDKCSEVFEVPDFNVRKELPPFKESQVTFTPTKAGTYGFRCGMDMMHGTIVVSDATKAGN